MTNAKKVSEFVDYAPPADVIEDAAGVKLLLDVPGATSDGLSINIEAGELKLTADTNIERSEKTVRYKRTFQISDNVDVEKAKAKITDGVLELTLPKHEHAKVHRVKIEK
jgi:HSP20 family molecular chaperone IbpA